MADSATPITIMSGLLGNPGLTGLWSLAKQCTRSTYFIIRASV